MEKFSFLQKLPDPTEFHFHFLKKIASSSEWNVFIIVMNEEIDLNSKQNTITIGICFIAGDGSPELIVDMKKCTNNLIYNLNYGVKIKDKLGSEYEFFTYITDINQELMFSRGFEEDEETLSEEVENEYSRLEKIILWLLEQEEFEKFTLVE